ncbi:ribonucleotide reductase stimulatory protein [Enterococcus faecalis]|uniref:Ribonucleotide reductase stimulatory protein n=1 Tax=Enterococcus faecalis TaxID=1351 RepID=A0AAX2KWH0_ENTFL|nr:ribonucleotide reductase stimulatory protein [Enterococcus faecalis]
MKLVYFSVTGQTRRFIKKLDLPAYELEPANPFFEINEPFILVIPTYDAEITEVVNDFLDYKSNQELLVGVAGGATVILLNYLSIPPKILPRLSRSASILL